MSISRFLQVASDLEDAGLVWQPEVGDEVSDKTKPTKISVLVDPMGMSPDELRMVYLWLPTVEQMVLQLEVRQAILFHAGLELSEREYCYRTVIRGPISNIETSAENLRTSLALGLRNLLLSKSHGLH